MVLIRAAELRQEAQTVMLFAVNGKAARLLGVAGPIKGSITDTIKLLREAGLKVVMLIQSAAGETLVLCGVVRAVSGTDHSAVLHVRFLKRLPDSMAQLCAHLAKVCVDD